VAAPRSFGVRARAGDTGAELSPDPSAAAANSVNWAPRANRASSAATAPGDAGRSSGRFASMRPTSAHRSAGSSGRSALSGGTASFRCADMSCR